MLNETQLQESVEYLMNYIVKNTENWEGVSPKYKVGDTFLMYLQLKDEKKQWYDNIVVDDAGIWKEQAYYNKLSGYIEFVYEVYTAAHGNLWLTSEEIDQKCTPPEGRTFERLTSAGYKECDVDGIMKY